VKIIIIEFDDELRECIQFLFEEHETTCYKTINLLPEDLLEVDFIIIDLDHKLDEIQKYLSHLRSRTPRAHIIGTSSKNEIEGVDHSLFDRLLFKPHISPLLDIIKT